MWANYSTDQKNFTGHIFNIKLEEKSHKMSLKKIFTGHIFNIKLEEKPHKMSFKVLPVKIQQSKKTDRGRGGGRAH